MTTSLVTQSSVDISDTDDLTEILKRLTNAKPTEVEAVQSPSKAINTIQVTETATKALTSLRDLLGAVALPSTRREATPSELEAMAELVKTAKAAVEAVNAATEGVREAAFNHFDVSLEEMVGPDGEVDADIDRKGHYLVKQEIFVPGQNVRLTRELREQQPKVTATDLRTLWKSGQITREDYMTATKHVDTPREVVNEQLAALLKRKPQLLPVIAGAITPGDVTAAFYVREPVKNAAKKG